MQKKDALPHSRQSRARTEVRQKVERATEIFDLYGDSIRALILFHVNDETEVDDIFQDLFISLVRKPVPAGIQDVKGYLYKTVINDVLDASRRTKGYQSRLLRYAEHLRYDRFEDSPETIALRTEAMDKIFQLIEEQLPRHQAEAVLHRYKDGRTMQDAASKMNIRQRTLSRYLCMGLKKLRQLLDET